MLNLNYLDIFIKYYESKFGQKYYIESLFLNQRAYDTLKTKSIMTKIDRSFVSYNFYFKTEDDIKNNKITIETKDGNFSIQFQNTDFYKKDLLIRKLIAYKYNIKNLSDIKYYYYCSSDYNIINHNNQIIISNNIFIEWVNIVFDELNKNRKTLLFFINKNINNFNYDQKQQRKLLSYEVKPILIKKFIKQYINFYETKSSCFTKLFEGGSVLTIPIQILQDNLKAIEYQNQLIEEDIQKTTILLLNTMINNKKFFI